MAHDDGNLRKGISWPFLIITVILFVAVTCFSLDAYKRELPNTRVYHRSALPSVIKTAITSILSAKLI